MMTTRTLASRIRWAVALLAFVLAPCAAHAQSGVVEYYHLDAVGSVRAVTAEDGSLLRLHDFKLFGEEITPPNTADRKLFTGQERDHQTGLDYVGARYYRPDLGRFTTVDPDHANGNTGDSQSWSPYASVRNNPLKYVDPTGLLYVVCANGAASCGEVSDQYFEGYLLYSPGVQGLTFRAGWIFLEGYRDPVGWYSQLYKDDTFASMIHDAGQRADAGLTAGVVGLGASAIIGATGGLAAGVWGGGLSAGGAWEGLGVLARGPSPGQVSYVQRVLAQRGRVGLEKAIRQWERLIAEHSAKIDEAQRAGRYTSSMEREIRNFRELVEAARRLLGR